MTLRSRGSEKPSAAEACLLAAKMRGGSGGGEIQIPSCSQIRLFKGEMF